MPRSTLFRDESIRSETGGQQLFRPLLLYGRREKYIRVKSRYPPFWGPEARSMLNWFETKGSLRLTGLALWKSFVQACYGAN